MTTRERIRTAPSDAAIIEELSRDIERLHELLRSDRHDSLLASWKEQKQELDRLRAQQESAIEYLERAVERFIEDKTTLAYSSVECALASLRQERA